VLAGALAGLVLSALAGRLVATLLYRLEPGDVSVAAAAATVLAAVSLFAAWVPSRRIARDDLTRLLRET
jgi:ABC-type antimicrobial peptide transport system permease subunit